MKMPVFEPGTAVLVVTDEGPNGICGQAVSITSPRASVHIFPSEQAMRDFCAKDQFKARKKVRMDYTVIGGDDLSFLSVTIHPEVQP